MPRRRRTLTAGQVVFAAGTYGTQSLLHRMKATGALPHLSGRLGALTRTNSEALLGVERFRSRGADHSRGVAITSSSDADDHADLTRSGPGPNAMGMGRLRPVDVDGRAPPRRSFPFLRLLAPGPWEVVRLRTLRPWPGPPVIRLFFRPGTTWVTDPPPGARSA